MSLKINVLASWLAHAVTLLIGFFLMPFVLKTIGDQAYGAWVFINSVAGFSSLLYLGFGDTIARFTSTLSATKQWEKLNRVASSIFSIYALMASVALCVGLGLAAAAPWLSDWKEQSILEVRWTFVILGMNVFVAMIGSVFGGILMGMQRFDLEKGIAVTIGILRLGLTLYFLKHQQGLITLASIYLGVTVVENVLLAIFAFRLVPSLRIRIKDMTRETYQECFSFSAFAFVAIIANHLVYMTDTAVIGFLLGPIAVVPYYVAARLTEFMRIPVIQLAEVFLPKAGELHAQAETDKLKSLVLRGMNIALLLIISLLIGSWFYSELLVNVWLGKTYSETWLILMLLLVGQSVALPGGVMRKVLFGIGQVKRPAYLYLLEAVSNLLLSLALMPSLGITGVAIGTLVPILLIEGGLLIPYGMKQLHISFNELWHQVIYRTLKPMTFLWAYAVIVAQWNLPENWLSVIGLAGGASVVLGTAWYFCDYRPERAQQESSEWQNDLATEGASS